ncbi:MAG: hypothetical protein COT85_03775 [Chlamydiae bacterium CG10_big_fil_rev_8_21_14_0_10_42_34]|nr:MAG: hypothetical protein COT85_03775 [Chlamydiae bacterium CG10_big_fil_rev_8_21_14_0_10_42_34]
MHYILIFLLTFASLGAKYCNFIPPDGWEIAQLKNPSPYVQIGFIGKGSTDFRPSINLATEEVDVSLKEYVKAVKELQAIDQSTTWRDLGKLTMRGGKGRLIEISRKTPFGDSRILQAIFVKGGTAYILTAAVLKDDLPKYQAEILKTFQSLTVAPDLWSLIPNSDQKNQFMSLFQSLGNSEDKGNEWNNLQNQVQNLAQMGPYWQFLALQEGREKIYPTKGELP